MRATILALGLTAGLFGTTGEASAQYFYPNYYSGGYVPPTYSRGPFVGGRYLAVPNYGFGYGSGYGYPAYNFGYSNYGYGYRGGFGYPSYGFRYGNAYRYRYRY